MPRIQIHSNGEPCKTSRLYEKFQSKQFLNTRIVFETRLFCVSESTESNRPTKWKKVFVPRQCDKFLLGHMSGKDKRHTSKKEMFLKVKTRSRKFNLLHFWSALCNSEVKRYNERSNRYKACDYLILVRC